MEKLSSTDQSLVPKRLEITGLSNALEGLTDELVHQLHSQQLDVWR